MSDPENNKNNSFESGQDDRFPVLEGVEEELSSPEAPPTEKRVDAGTPSETADPDPTAASPGDDMKYGIATPGAEAKPDQTAWNWTDQYTKAASARIKDKEKEGSGDARGFGEMGDPNASPEDAKMAAMYIPKEKVKQVHNPDLTYTPQVEVHHFPWKPVIHTIDFGIHTLLDDHPAYDGCNCCKEGCVVV